MKKTSTEKLKEAVKNSISFAGVLRYLNKKQAGGSQSHYKRRIINEKIDFSHFTGQAWAKNKNTSKERKTAKDILILRKHGGRCKSHFLVRALIETGSNYVCDKCGQDDNWMGNKLTLDVDHINNNFLDDRRENLRFLCPNCHSQFSRGLILKEPPKYCEITKLVDAA